MKSLIHIFTVLLLSSCMAFHTGQISSGPLLSANDRCVDIASGYASTNIFLGIGGLSKDALVQLAKKDMMNNRPLKKGEYYSNFTVDFKRTVSIVTYVENEVFVHADILSVNEDKGMSVTVIDGFTKTEKPTVTLTYVKTKQDSFYVGEKVVYRSPESPVFDFTPYEISAFTSDEKVSLKSFKSTEENIYINPYNLGYSMDKERNGFKYGDSATYKPTNYIFPNKTVSGKIIATSSTRVLILRNGKTEELEYKEITKINKAK